VHTVANRFLARITERDVAPMPLFPALYLLYKYVFWLQLMREAEVLELPAP
jgi:hypothetical protein